MQRYFGVDIGGTNVVVGVVCVDGTVQDKESFPTAAPRPAAALCGDIAAACCRLMERNGLQAADFACVGAACPGLVAGGVVRSAVNLGFTCVDLRAVLEECLQQQGLSLPAAVCNDANAAALAEALVGAGRGCHSLAMVTIGTGIGGGIVMNGRIVEGVNGAAAEIGHITVEPNGEPCGCGKRGCLEAYCSARSLIRETRIAMARYPESALWQVAGNLSGVNGYTVFAAMDQGDAAAQGVFDAFVARFAVGVTDVITLLQPEVLCIGGGMSAQGDRLVRPIAELVMQDPLLHSLPGKTRIVPAALQNDAGVIGAALHAAQEGA